MNAISISSKPLQGEPSFSAELIFTKGEAFSCRGYEQVADASTGHMCELGGYLWLAPLVLVVPPQFARRCRQEWKKNRIGIASLHIMQPKPRVRDQGYRVLAIAFGTCPLERTTSTPSHVVEESMHEATLDPSMELSDGDDDDELL